MKALLIVDVQNDFCTGGVLAAKGGEEVAPIINKVAPSFNLVVASKDWHPTKTKHFDKWPPHCVQNTKGAAFHPDLNLDFIDKIALKGTGTIDDGYSAFEATNINLSSYFNNEGITSLYISGIATDYCVLHSVIDAIKAGFKTYVITDAIRGVNLEPNDSQEALKQMEQLGCILITSEEFLDS
ncbi:isochorismatase family protein [Joostella atrarenae]|uniref:nicotinamidase n=1 Tax=Joostella atrarenae TaxID=679257 RepID=A0ABS9J0G3_9FLAO|nr:isochorismatase family protein [Joostella atrarenae]MCF8713879.1 isochorismatase family protein [Joostella atrarenae]